MRIAGLHAEPVRGHRRVTDGAGFRYLIVTLLVGGDCRQLGGLASGPPRRPRAAHHEIALPLITDPGTDKQADNKCNGRTLDADGESTVAHNLDGPLHLQRPDVPICNLPRRGATNLYSLRGDS